MMATPTIRQAPAPTPVERARLDAAALLAHLLTIEAHTQTGGPR